MTQTTKPIFIIGVHRSGTTLLRFMLNSHPNIYIPPESDFIPNFFINNPTSNLSKHEIDRLLKRIFSKYRFVREWQGDPPESNDFPQNNVTPHVFLNCLYQMYAQQNDATRWGDKTPIYCSYVDLIDTIFPSSQFIHIIRDGRDVALSMIDKWGKQDFHIDIYFTAQNWVRRINQARTSGNRLGQDRYIEINYEDLVSKPEDELIRVCDYLGENYLPLMSQPHLLGQIAIEPGSFHDPIRDPPSESRTYRWRQEMSYENLHIFETIASNLLIELGYTVFNRSEKKVSYKQRIRILFLTIKYHILQWGRRSFTKLGLLPPI